MRTAVVNGYEISAEAVHFELDRLARFYMSQLLAVNYMWQNQIPKIKKIFTRIRMDVI